MTGPDPADETLAESRRRVLAPAPPDKASAVTRLRRLVAAIPAEADVVALGDSLVAGWPDALMQRAFPGATLFNFGFGGDRIQTALWRLDTLAVAHLRPRTCLILLGTNNLGDGDPPDAISAGLEAVAERVGALWQRPSLIVVTLPWRLPRTASGEGDRLKLNGKLLPELARRTGAILVESDRAFRHHEAALHLEEDGLHVSPSGYDRLTRLLSETLGR